MKRFIDAAFTSSSIPSPTHWGMAILGDFAMKGTTALLRLTVAVVIAWAIILPGLAHADDTNHSPYLCNDGNCNPVNVTAKYTPPPPPPAPSINNYSAGEGGVSGNERGDGGRDFSPHNTKTTTKKIRASRNAQITAVTR
ncbi:MAG TPA: hypothetical protein VFI81_06135 [Rhodanobacteraceae bacterium]|nr:hypothetical protein [Rhodanobacteraceae bacterium]